MVYVARARNVLMGQRRRLEVRVDGVRVGVSASMKLADGNAQKCFFLGETNA